MTEILDQLRSAVDGRYTVHRQVGQGATALVFLGEDLLGAKVAIKVLQPDLASSVTADRFVREIQIAMQLSHPHIVGLRDSGIVSGLPFYVMPFVDGESLRERLIRQAQLPLAEVIGICGDVAGALDHAHERDVVHRDIKPDNILLRGREAFVVDFGIARAMTIAGDAKLTKTGMTVGTAAYMSPEQARGVRKLDGRSDIYNLGCVVYEMLAGHVPFVGSQPHELLLRHLHDPVPRLVAARPDVPGHVERAVVRALAKKPGDRFSRATDLVAALTDQEPPPPRLAEYLRAAVRIFTLKA